MPSYLGVDAIEQALDAESRSHTDAGERCLVSTGHEGLLTGNPRTRTATEQAIPHEPPATRHDVETVAAAITESVERHGVRATWG